MEKKQIVMAVVAACLFAAAVWIFMSGEDTAAVPLQKRIVEVPAPAVVQPPEAVEARIATAAPQVVPVLLGRREIQQQIEDQALLARKYGFEAEAEKAKAEIATAKAAQAESALRVKRADAAPLKEEKEVPVAMPTQPYMAPPIPQNMASSATKAEEAAEPRGLAGAKLTMMSNGAVVVDVDGRSLRLHSGASAGGYRLVDIDREARSAAIRDSRGRTRTLYLDMTAPRTAPEFSRERVARQETPQPAATLPLPIR